MYIVHTYLLEMLRILFIPLFPDFWAIYSGILLSFRSLYFKITCKITWCQMHLLLTWLTIHAIRLKEYVHIPLRCWGFWGDTILGPHTVQCRSLENIPQVRATWVLHLAAQDSTWVHWLVSSSLPLIFKLKAQLPSGMCPLYHENYYLYCKCCLHSSPCLCFLRR